MYLSVAHYYRIVEEPSVRGPWRVQSGGYSYILHANDGTELFAFQWHPHGAGPMVTPHVHLGPALGLGDPRWPKLHVPTSRISIEQVVRLSIEIGAEPQRKDWEKILDETESAFVQWRSWG